MICYRCKESLEITDAVLGGYVCPYCGKFNPRKLERIWCLEKGCKKNKEVGRYIEKFERRSVDKDISMLSKRFKIKI